ncbi:MAG: hypothetical protein JWP34_4348 [Massilia sp.]|jgi:hypothetical protein|nr:hypothetical protein [Massilia sp.]
MVDAVFAPIFRYFDVLGSASRQLSSLRSSVFNTLP